MVGEAKQQYKHQNEFHGALKSKHITELQASLYVHVHEGRLTEITPLIAKAYIATGEANSKSTNILNK